MMNVAYLICQVLLINMLRSREKKYRVIIKESRYCVIYCENKSLRLCLMLIASPFISAGSQNSHSLAARFVFLIHAHPRAPSRFTEKITRREKTSLSLASALILFSSQPRSGSMTATLSSGRYDIFIGGRPGRSFRKSRSQK